MLEQTDLPCSSPVISSDGRDAPLETEISEVQTSESFREPLGTAFLNLSDQQGNSVDLSCNITHTAEPEGITPPSDLSPSSSSSPLPLALSLSLECPVERQGYENLWRILAYYSETAVRLEREIMLSKAPTLAYRYKQAAEAEGYYHTGVEASVRAKPDWLLQSAISIQLNRVQSNGHTVHLIYSSRVSAHPDPMTHSALSAPSFHPWVLISTNHTITALAAAAGSKVELPCPVLSSGSPQVQWILPDGSRHISNKPGGRLRASTSGLLVQNVRLADSGIYHCLVRVAGDVDILPLRLVVEETSVPPSGEQVAPTVTSAVGEYAILSCQASGSPVPQISWLLPDGNLVRHGVSVSGGLRMQPDGSLSLNNPSKRDAGYYRCIAVNQYGSDSLSMQLELHSQQNPLLRDSFPRGPQSAAGRSTKIRAPLLQTGEGSGGGEEEEDGATTGGRMPRPRQPFPNRRMRPGHPRRRGPIRGPLRRIVSPTDQRRNHFPNRQRVTPNQKRIDPQKWADILAKIRQKTATANSSQPVTADDSKAELMATEKPTQPEEPEGEPDVKSSEADRVRVDAETEGSSLDTPDLQEEDLQPINQVLRETQTNPKEKMDSETDSPAVTITENPMNVKGNTQTYTLTGQEDSQTQVTASTERQNKPVTSTPNPGRNGITSDLSEGKEREENPVPTRASPQRTRLVDLANVVPNSRPQRPWNSRRRIGQRRRIINRPRVRPLPATPPRPDPTRQKPQIERPETTTSQIDVQLLPSTVSPPAVLLTQDNHVKDRVAVNSLSPTVSDTPVTSPTSLASISRKDQFTHPANILEATDSTFLTTPPPTQSYSTITAMHISATETRADMPGIQMHAVTQTPLGKHADIPSSKHREELERNLAGEPYVTHSSTPVVSPPFSSAAPTAASTTEIAATPPSTHKMTESTLTTTSGDTFGATEAIVLTTTVKIIPTTNASKITAPRYTSTTATTTAATTPTTTTTTSAPSPTVPSDTSAAYFATSATKSPEKITQFQASSTVSIPAQTSPPTTKSATGSAPTAATETVPATTASSREKPNVFDHRGWPVPGDTNLSRLPTDWKNPGANSIPDSHSSRPRWTPTPLLPPVAGVSLIYI